MHVPDLDRLCAYAVIFETGPEAKIEVGIEPLDSYLVVRDLAGAPDEALTALRGAVRPAKPNIKIRFTIDMEGTVTTTEIGSGTWISLSDGSDCFYVAKITDTRLLALVHS